MIIDQLSQIKKYTPHDELISEFVHNVKLNTVITGEWIYLNNEIKALVLIKSNYSENIFESHTKYDDLHIVVNGTDTIFLGDSENALLKEEYNQIGDYTLFTSDTKSTTQIKEDMFALINKGEIHSNKIEGDFSKKVVIKLI